MPNMPWHAAGEKLANRTGPRAQSPYVSAAKPATTAPTQSTTITDPGITTDNRPVFTGNLGAPRVMEIGLPTG